eukprot:TRINITY_DN727_c1_g2_i3.p1 TRINITY_DN727_c1_g2~~TRINITY_DN727_c1_g2_i3.p1  ORF type:complete len:785 (+),score=92.40 TRINITY_DN727_c1_g2_i3:2314-4668(+)
MLGYGGCKLDRKFGLRWVRYVMQVDSLKHSTQSWIDWFRCGGLYQNVIKIFWGVRVIPTRIKKQVNAIVQIASYKMSHNPIENQSQNVKEAQTTLSTSVPLPAVATSVAMLEGQLQSRLQQQYVVQNTAPFVPPPAINLAAPKLPSQTTYPVMVGGRTVQTGVTNMPVYTSPHIPTLQQSQQHQQQQFQLSQAQQQQQVQQQKQQQSQQVALWQQQPGQSQHTAIISDSSGQSSNRKNINEEERQIVRSLQAEFENTFKASQFATMFSTGHEVYKRAIKNYVFGMIPENLQKKLEVTPVTKFSPLQALEYSVQKHAQQKRAQEQQQQQQQMQQQQQQFSSLQQQQQLQQQMFKPTPGNQVVSPHLLRPVTAMPPQPQPQVQPQSLPLPQSQVQPPSQIQPQPQPQISGQTLPQPPLPLQTPPITAQGIAVTESEGEVEDSERAKRPLPLASLDQKQLLGVDAKRPRLGMEPSGHTGVGVGVGGMGIGKGVGVGAMEGGTPTSMFSHPSYNKMYGYMGHMAGWTGSRGVPNFPRGVQAAAMMSTQQQQQQQMIQSSSNLQQPSSVWNNQAQLPSTGSKPVVDGQIAAAVTGGTQPSSATAISNLPFSKPMQPPLPLPVPVPSANITPTPSAHLPEVRGRSSNPNLLPRPSRMHSRHYVMDDGKVLPLRGLQTLIRSTGFQKNYEYDLAVEQEIQNCCQDFLSDVIQQGLAIAKRRKSTKLEVSDLELAVELRHHLKIPGFTKNSNATLKRQFHRPTGSEIHRKVQADVRRSQAQAQKVSKKTTDT